MNAEQREALMAAADGLTTMLEFATGQRERAIAQGYSPTVAEMMAMHVHNELVTMVFCQDPK